MHTILYPAHYRVGASKVLTIIGCACVYFGLQVVNTIRSRAMGRMSYTWLSPMKKANQLYSDYTHIKKLVTIKKDKNVAVVWGGE